MSKRLYLGYFSDYRKQPELFWCEFTPTTDSHGNKYSYVTGPFRTKKGAEFMRDFGRNNPHCLCVSDAEKLARTLDNRV